jgi:hypothetical protein
MKRSGLDSVTIYITAYTRTKLKAYKQHMELEAKRKLNSFADQVEFLVSRYDKEYDLKKEILHEVEQHLIRLGIPIKEINPTRCFNDS